MYKTLFIDWDGTLCKSRFWERWSKDPEYQDKYNLIQKVFFQHANDFMQDWMMGSLSTASVLNYLAETTDLSYKELVKELRYSCEHMEFIDKEAINKIQSFRKQGVKVVIATDNVDTFRHWTIPALGINTLFDGVLTSDTRGALKSQSNDNGISLFFQHYLGQNNIKPGETVLIDNSLNNKVVENFGIDFLHVNAENTLTIHLSRLAQPRNMF